MADLVEAVGVASPCGVATRSRIIAKTVAAAMQQAVEACVADGISATEANAPIIRARMLMAQQDVLDRFDALARQRATQPTPSTP